MKAPYLWLFIFTILFPFLGFSETISTVEDPCTKLRFPKTVSFSERKQNEKLPITGVCGRKSGFFSYMYALGHYMEGPFPDKPEEIYQLILADNKPKQLTFEWTSDVDLEDIQEDYKKSFHKILSDEEYAPLASSIDEFINLYHTDIKKGETHFLRWLPGGKIELLVKGEEKTLFPNPDFAKALWSLWFGPKSIVSREPLISFIVERK